jgi:uncharacterized repeat protein (TIGR03943 family)
MGDPVNRTARALVLTAIGGVALRVGVTDEYANYVNGWMRWPLVVSGVLLIGLALLVILTALVRDDHEHDHDPASRTVPWLLLLPVVVGFVIRPPELGAYVAERRANQVDARTYSDPAVVGLDETGENVLRISDFVARATYDDGASLDGVTVRLTGFVSTDRGGGWYVTRVAISCCAADAAAFRVRVDDADEPPKDQWVDVVGTWVDGTGTDVGGTPVIAADEVTFVDRPKRPYE